MRYRDATHKELGVGAERCGVVQCKGAVPYDVFTVTQHSNPAGSSDSQIRDFLQGTTSTGGYWVRARDAETLRCRVTGASSQEEFAAACRSFDFALSVATGSTCCWLSAAQVCEDEVQVRLGTPLEPWRSRPSDFPAFDGRRSFDAVGFRELIARVVAAGQDPVLDHHLRLLYLWWDTNAAMLQTRGLVVSTLIEALADEAGSRLVPAEVADRVGEDRRSMLDALKASPAVAANPLFDRLCGFARSALGAPRASDVLQRLAHTDPPLLTGEEVRAWKDLRHRLAHGEFDPDAHAGRDAMFRRVVLCANVLNKLVLALVGYTGSFVDYSQQDWPVVAFPWRRAAPG